ncbi:MAG: sigma factor-like helix-turn-helix DNA-binding protein [Planctomycetota bacterium]|jgi:RNA polymerase sigma factor (sigma-70 family)
MTTQEALKTLEEGGEWPALAEAIGVVVSDPMTSFDALMLGLQYKGIVAEQAALGLYRRTLRPIPDNRRVLITDADEWRQWLREVHLSANELGSDCVSRDLLAERLTRGLSREERLVLLLNYYEHMTMKEIGAVLNLSESRVSQIHEGILLRLRKRFGETVGDALQKIA